MQRGLWIILGVVVLDSIGIGLVWPILPELIRQMSGGQMVAAHYGVLSALYALMQFLCAPLLGLLSDRFGRRPVLLVSLAAAAADYALMAVTPSMSLLYVGRIISGMMAANMAVAQAYIADVTPPEERGRRFGWVSACFGLGFIAGPALGGWLGAFSIRAPFWAAVALNALNFALALAFLPETRSKDERRFDWKGLNPFAPMGQVFRAGDMTPLFLVFVVVTMVGQIGGVIWVLYGHDRFAWDTRTTGLSLAVFGLFHALVQGGLTGPVIKRIGERGAFVVSVVFDAIAYVGMGLATHGWMVFALIPLLCLGGMEAPALQAIFSRNTGDERQGELNGLLTGLGSLAGVAAAVGVTLIYAATQRSMPGLVWFVGAALFVLCIPGLIAARPRPARV
jgi:DHA1 family tetracycline resistance protein-like MFS transporter